MLPEDTEGKVIGPALYIKCKIDTGANVMPISNNFYPATFDSSWKPLEKFNAEWTSLTACELRIMKCIWNNQKWKLLFHVVDAQGPILLILKTLKTHRDIQKTPWSLH